MQIYRYIVQAIRTQCDRLTCSPERSSRRRVAEAPRSWILLPEHDRKDGGGARAQRMTHADNVEVMAVTISVAGERLGQEVLVLQLSVDVGGSVHHALKAARTRSS